MQVCAAGWHAQLLLWEDTDDAEVSSYRALPAHREDIMAMAAAPEYEMLATGDYAGYIQLWNLYTAEKKGCLLHRAER